ncbi:hypothetical protein MKW92_002026 [Papaver armeniacum]|nr:hypothetical protein MKW92_002026 [Papaver armeniacum]
MAELSSLIHRLREIISASSSAASSSSQAAINGVDDDDDQFENRFRSVLPNLLLHPQVSSISQFMSEITYFKAFITYSKNFPGVYFHLKASVVIPAICRVLPAEPEFSNLRDIWIPPSLLRSGHRGADCQFFLDDILLVEKKQNNASHQKSPLNSLKKPVDPWWHPFATWTLKIISKCLTEGTLYVEGLISVSFVSMSYTLLCALEMLLYICDAEIVSMENLLFSILSILGHSEKEHPTFRSTVYYSCMGACLNILYSTCPDDVVELTAGDLVNAFPESLKNTDSLEHKVNMLGNSLIGVDNKFTFTTWYLLHINFKKYQVAMCSAYVRMSKTFFVHIWKPETLVNMMYYSKLCLPVMDCLCVAIGKLGPDSVGYVNPGNTDINKSTLTPDIAVTALSMLCIIFCNYPKTCLALTIFRQVCDWMPWISEHFESITILNFPCV